MTRLSRQDQIWNRAALESGGSAPAAGDVALAALLRAHGLITMGGVQQALALMDDTQRCAALAGFRYFDLESAAWALEWAIQVNTCDSNELDWLYWRAVPSDESIVAAFRKKLADSSGEFAETE